MGTAVAPLLLLSLFVFIAVTQLANNIISPGIKGTPWIKVLLFAVVMACFLLVPATAPDLQAIAR